MKKVTYSLIGILSAISIIIGVAYINSHIPLPVNKKLSVEVTSRYGERLEKIGVVNIQSGSSVFGDTDEISLYDDVEFPGLLKRTDSWVDFGRDQMFRDLKFFHIIKDSDRYSVYYVADESNSFDEELSEITYVLDRVIERHAKNEKISKSWREW